MEEDLSKMKAQKVSKKDNLTNLVNSVTKSSSSASKPKNSGSSTTSKNSSTKSSSTAKKSNSSSKKTSSTPVQIGPDGQPIKRKRGRPRKNPLPEETIPSTVAQIIISDAIEKSARKYKKQAKKSLKKNGFSLILMFVFLGVGLLSGFLISKFCVSALFFPNDTYEMVAYKQGDKYSTDIYISQDIDETDEFTYVSYTELGVKCIAFGKDYSRDYTVEYFYRNDLTNDEVKVDGIDVTKEGVYYAVYSIPCFKYKSVTLIRNIFVLRGEDSE